MTDLEVRADLDETEFVREYMKKNRPVVIENCMSKWPAYKNWDIRFFNRRYGECPVLIQTNTFRPIDVLYLSDFFDKLKSYEEQDCFGRTDVPFLRVSKIQGVDTLDLAEKVISDLHADWEVPSFFPSSLFLKPNILNSADPTKQRFPSFGVYFSPRGACTSLHFDADFTSALSFQILGRKRWYLFSPEVLDPLTIGKSEPKNILKESAPKFCGVEPTHEIELQRGQILYVPGDWAHEVYTMETSISLTFNFVHLSEAISWLYALSKFTKRNLHKKAESPPGDNKNQPIDGPLSFGRNIVAASRRPEFKNERRRWSISTSDIDKIDGLITQVLN